MNVVSRMDDQQTLNLSRALLIYDSGTAHGRTPDTALVTIHDITVPVIGQRGSHLRGKITQESLAPQIGPGRLLDRATFSEVWRSVSGLPQRREILPANILFHDAGRMVWHVASKRRRIWFSTRYEGLNPTVGKLREDLNGREVLYPALLFMAEPGHLYVWALASDERPSADTPVFVAPFCNLYDSGHMCRGNVRLPDACWPGDLPTWEDAFFLTEFTHSNYGRQTKLTLHPRGHDGLWRGLVWRQDWRGFPIQHLTPLIGTTAEPVTVGEIIGREVAA